MRTLHPSPSISPKLSLPLLQKRPHPLCLVLRRSTQTKRVDLVAEVYVGRGVEGFVFDQSPADAEFIGALGADKFAGQGQVEGVAAAAEASQAFRAAEAGDEEPATARRRCLICHPAH